jgi:amidase
MKRRTFITSTAATGVAVFSAPVVQSCSLFNDNKVTGNEFNTDFEINEVTISQLQQYLQSGKYTSEKLVSFYLNRIRKIDKAGPVLNSVIEINPDAIDISVQLDKERKSGKVRSPLHGIPVLIKDNIGTADKMLTTAGSMAMTGSPAKMDAYIVSRLREAGAIILGKTNLSEWANFRSNRSTSGWSGRGGQTRNPYITDRNPCGSSSGSGVAVSANLCAAAIGTETNGSIMCPSSINGIVGIKPTLGLWSRSGIIPIAHSQDTAGPMTRTVSDATLMLGLLTGIDPLDKASIESQGNIEPDYTKYLDMNGLNKTRIGVARNFFGFNQKVDQLIEEAIQAMKAKGAEIIDPANIDTAEEIGRYEMEVLLYEFKADLNLYLSNLPSSAKCRSLKELIIYNEENKEIEMPWFGQELFLSAENIGPLTDQVYIDALSNLRRFAGKEGIDAVLQKHNLDAVVAPTGGPAWTTDWVNGDHGAGGSSDPAACAGYPAITVPAGFIHGLPIGITFMGTAWSEPTLIKLAYAYEQATKHRKCPEFIPSLS